jgi:hypothetical protein
MAEVAQRLPGVPRYQDFRRLFEDMRRQIDAVVVATPDNNHALIAAAAMRCGKPVYVEKPMAHDVAEARALRRIAREQKVATQMGNQGMASDQFRRALELIRQGAVGEIREAHVWFVMGGSGPRRRPRGTHAVPKHLRWDLWLAPNAVWPYHPSYVTGWGSWRDIGTGTLGGCGSHALNLAFKALEMSALWEGSEGANARIGIEAEISEQCTDTFPRWQTLRFDVPARGSRPPARIHWYSAPEGALRKRGIWQRMEKIAGRPLDWKQGWTPQSGTLLVGSKGVVHTNAHNSLCTLLPEKDFPQARGRPRSIPSVASHQIEWLNACTGGPAPLSNFDHSGPVMEMLLAGNIATLVDKPLEYDPVAGTIPNDETARTALRRQYAKGWVL